MFIRNKYSKTSQYDFECPDSAVFTHSIYDPSLMMECINQDLSCDNLAVKISHHIAQQSVHQSTPRNSMLSRSSWPANLRMDLMVRAGGSHIACDRSALVASSGYFASNLNINPASVTIDLPTVPGDVFQTLLLYIYTGHLQLTNDNIYQMFWYSQMLQIPGAVLKCTQFLTSKLNSSEAISPTTPAADQSLKTSVVKPIARPGVPLLPLNTANSSSYNFLGPHLASFYSDWFLRYSTPTRNSFMKTSQQQKPASSSQNNITKENEDRSVLLETAACDGPVKFHRVLNQHFTLDLKTPREEDSEDEVDMDKEEDNKDDSRAGETYSCAYCSHVFKSHYCYQKHKRRHINPVTVDGEDLERKMLVMKDLNVQYFPCKICGAKFPSYYFVHKHKKLWHPAHVETEEMLLSNDQTSA